MSQKEKHILLIGNPNCGKSTIFNNLTGLNQKITNLPGTTIEKKVGVFKIEDQTYRITDLPGAYSIYPNGEDEILAIDYLKNSISNHQVDLILYIADAANLQRNLLFFSQIADLKLPIILVLNMIDLATYKGIEIDIDKLSESLGVLVIALNSKKNTAKKELINKIHKEHQVFQSDFFKKDTISFQQHWNNNIEAIKENKEGVYKKIALETNERYLKIQNILTPIQSKNTQNAKFITHKLDKFLLHPIYGILSLFAVLFLIFQFIFKVAQIPADWIDYGFSYLIRFVSETLPIGKLNDLICDGVLAGVGGIVIFLPQIVLLFVFLTILEETGYMTRVSFISDNLMKKFGLNGKSVIPLIGGMACAIPSIMAARNIENSKDRIITILVTPLMSCSARIPVYTLLAGLLVEKNDGIIHYRGLLMLVMYVLGFVASLLFGLLFKLILKQKEKSFFILEMPDYKLPQIKNVLRVIYSKSMDFVVNAGKIILIVSILLWFLANHAPKNNFANIEKKYENYLGQDKNSLISSEKLESSYIGIMGRSIEPAIKPLGYDWKIGIALITSFAAREIFTGTLATIYRVQESDDDGNKKMLTILKEQKRADNGLPLYSVATIVSLLLFYAFAMQCFSTLAVTYRETKALKWPLIQFFYMTGFAYLASLIAYQLLS